MTKQLIQQIEEYVRLYRDTKTGIAWIENGKTGDEHSAHPSIDATGSVKGMKSLGNWKKDARCVKSYGTIYNIDSCMVTDEYDEIARKHCRCGGKH